MSCVIKITGGTKQYARKVGSQRTKATNVFPNCANRPHEGQT